MPNQVVNQELTDLLIANGFAWRYEFSQSINAGATVYIGFLTSSDGAVLHDRSFDTDGDDTTFRLYRQTAYSGGSDAAIVNRNDRFWGVTARRALVEVKTGVTTTPDAADIMGSVRLLALGGPAVSIASESNHIVLAPSSSYVVSVTNNDSNPATCAMSLVIMRDMTSTGIMRWG